MNVSYVVPFFRQAAAFKMMLPVNDGFRFPDAEVVLVLDDPTEEQAILKIVRANTDIKFRVIVNDAQHDWRPPCVAFNVGIRHALADHLVFVDPDAAIVMPTPDFPKRLIRDDFRLCYAGLAWFDDDLKSDDSPELIRHKIQVCENIGKTCRWGSGFLLAPKIALERIFGFDEIRFSYAYDETDIRIRLARLGNRCVIDGQIKVFRPGQPGGATEPDPNFFPQVALAEQRHIWGKEFERVSFDWQRT